MTSAAPLSAAVPAAACDPRSGCITCGDEGIAMRVVAVGDDGLGSCEAAAGSRETVDLTLVAAGPGDDVLVHAGVALVRLGEGARP